MEHDIRIIRTDHENTNVPPAFHATCTCGWASESHDEASIQSAVDAHEHGDHEIPAPASPSPIVAVPD